MHLGGALGLNAELRPQAARPQGHQRRPRRLRHRRRQRRTSPTAPTASGSPPGSPAPTRSCCAGSRWRSDELSERVSRQFHCPYCGDENLFPQEGRGAWECRVVPARLHRADDRDDPPPGTDPPRGRRTMSLSTQRRPRLQGHPHRGTHARGAARAGLPRRRRARAGPGRGDHRVGRRDVRRPVRDHLLDGRRRARAPRLEGRPRHRRRVPRHRLPLHRDHRHPRRRRGHAARQPAHHRAPRSPSPSRTRSTARTSTRPTPTSAARCARSSRSPTRWRSTTPGPPACAAPRPTTGSSRRSSAGTPARARSRSRRWPGGATSRSSSYIADNGVLVNPLVHDGYPSIGCWPCTRRVAPGDDPRSGRWAGTAKTECGIHA